MGCRRKNAAQAGFLLCRPHRSLRAGRNERMTAAQSSLPEFPLIFILLALLRARSGFK